MPTSPSWFARAAVVTAALLGTVACDPSAINAPIPAPVEKAAVEVVDTSGMVIIGHTAAGNRVSGQLRYGVECAERAWAAAHEPGDPVPEDVGWALVSVTAAEDERLQELTIAAEQAGTWVPCPAGRPSP